MHTAPDVKYASQLVQILKNATYDVSFTSCELDKNTTCTETTCTTESHR